MIIQECAWKYEPAVLPPSSLKAELRRSSEQMKRKRRVSSANALPNPKITTRLSFEQHDKSVGKIHEKFWFIFSSRLTQNGWVCDDQTFSTSSKINYLPVNRNHTFFSEFTQV